MVCFLLQINVLANQDLSPCRKQLTVEDTGAVFMGRLTLSAVQWVISSKGTPEAALRIVNVKLFVRVTLF